MRPRDMVVGHRQLLGDAQRIVQRHEIAEHQELELLGPLRADRRHHVRRVHQPVRRGVVLVQPDAVEAELVHLLPGLQMLLVGPRRDLAVVVIERQRVGQILRRLVLVEVLSVGQKVEDEDFHVRGFLISAAELMVACRLRAYSHRARDRHVGGGADVFLGAGQRDARRLQHRRR